MTARPSASSAVHSSPSTLVSVDVPFVSAQLSTRSTASWTSRSARWIVPTGLLPVGVDVHNQISAGMGPLLSTHLAQPIELTLFFASRLGTAPEYLRGAV